MCKISFTQKKGMVLLKKWNIVIAEEFVRAYKLDDNSYLTDFEKNNLVYIFKKINTKTVVKQVKKSDYSKYFKRKTFIPSVVLQVELSEDRGPVRKMRIYNAKEIFLTIPTFLTTLRYV